MFRLELETRLYYLSITIMTHISPSQMGCSRVQTLKFDNCSHFWNAISNNPPTARVIITYCLRKLICDSPLTCLKGEKVQGREVLSMEIIVLESLHFCSLKMCLQYFLTQVCVFYRKKRLVCTYCDLKIQLFPFKSPIFF